MANSSRVDWGGTDKVVADNMTAYGGKVIEAIEAVAKYFEPILEQYSKSNAKWIDRTSNARQSLHSFSQRLGNEAVELYLSGGVQYQVYLETRWSARYAIIFPTIEAHIPQIKAMLDGIFK